MKKPKTDLTDKVASLLEIAYAVGAMIAPVIGGGLNDIDGFTEVVFVPDLPWEYLWSMPERDFWVEELESKANLIIMRLKDPKHFLTGDVQVAANSAQHLATPQFTAAGNNHGSPWTDPAAKAPKLLALGNGGKATGKGKEGKGKDGGGKARQVPDNTPANRCTRYNNGTCKHSTSPDLICPTMKSMVHRCSKCGGPHSWIECSQVSKKDKAAIGHGPKDAGAWSKPWAKAPKDKKRKGNGKEEW